jgi:hypothetical protein
LAIHHHDISHEPQATAVHGLNHPLRPPGIPYGPTCGFHAGGEGFIAHILVGPYLRQHLVAGDDAVALLDEIGQYPKYLGAERNTCPTPA